MSRLAEAAHGAEAPLRLSDSRPLKNLIFFACRSGAQQKIDGLMIFNHCPDAPSSCNPHGMRMIWR
jgi:hypothetical protein